MDKTEELKQPIVVCDCGCGVLRVCRYEFDKDIIEYGLVLYKEEFSNKQQTVLRLISTRIKHAWYTLIGKEFHLFDIVLTAEQFKEFKTNINKI